MKKLSQYFLLCLFFFFAMSHGLYGQSENLAVRPPLPTMELPLGEDEPLQEKDIFFSGQLRTQIPSYLLAPKDFSALQNFRYSPFGIKGRYGMTDYTSDAKTGKPVLEIIPYYKSNGDNALIAQIKDGSESKYYRFGSGAFGAANPILTTTNTDPCTYCQVNDHLCIGDSSGIYVWSGNSTKLTGALNYDDSLDVYTDRWEEFYSTVYDSYTFSASDADDRLYIGFERPFVGIDVVVESGANSLATMAVKYLKESTGAWGAVSNLSDGTSGLGSSGAITWDNPMDEVYPWGPHIIDGKYKFWIEVSAASGSSDPIDEVEVRTEVEPLRDIWYGDWMYPYMAGRETYELSDYKYEDYTGFVYLDNIATYLDATGVKGVSSPYVYLLFGFPLKPRQINIDIVPGYENNATNIMYFLLWTGSQFSTLSPYYTDGTASGGKSFAQSGILDFTGTTDYNIATMPKRRMYNMASDLYYFKMGFNATTTNDAEDIRVWQIRAIPRYDPPVGYTKVASFKNRLWLYGGLEPHIFKYSTRNRPDCFNGSDSMFLETGDKSSIIKALPFFDEMLIFKESGEIGIIKGYSPATFSYERLASIGGTIASRSVVSVESGLLAQGNLRQNVAIYVSADGVRTCNGLSTPLISQDISAYFDPNHSLNSSMDNLDDAVGWMDYANNEYHLLVPATNEIFVDREFVYSIDYNKWSIFDRSYFKIFGGIPIFEDNAWITLGGGTSATGSTKGQIYQLEDGSQDDGHDIGYRVETKDHTFGNIVNNFQGILLTGDEGGVNATVTLRYALDGNDTYTNAGDLDIDKTGYDLVNPDKKLNIHGNSIRLRLDAAIALELYKYSIYYAPIRTIRDHPGN